MSMMLAAMLLAVTATGDDDALIDAGQPEVVVTAVQKAGYRAELKINDRGQAYISSAANGSPFTIDFYDCENNKNCTSLQFYSWYKKDPIFTPAFTNEWNVSNRFLKIAVDKDGDLNLYFDITTAGKITYKNFADTLDWYTSLDAGFADFLAEKRKAIKPATGGAK